MIIKSNQNRHSKLYINSSYNETTFELVACIIFIKIIHFVIKNKFSLIKLKYNTFNITL